MKKWEVRDKGNIRTEETGEGERSANRRRREMGRRKRRSGQRRLIQERGIRR